MQNNYISERNKIIMPTSIKAFNLFHHLYNTSSTFKQTIDENLKNGKIRFFNDEEWDKIKNQNFISPNPELKNFTDMFILGYNIGNCIGTSRQLSYSYRNVDLVSGRLPILKGTLNAEKEGGHGWLENDNYIIDTSLMLVIDKSLKETIGYIEERRITAHELASSPIYKARRDFVNDKNINRHKIK